MQAPGAGNGATPGPRFSLRAMTAARPRRREPTPSGVRRTRFPRPGPSRAAGQGRECAHDERDDDTAAGRADAGGRRGGDHRDHRVRRAAGHRDGCPGGLRVAGGDGGRGPGPATSWSTSRRASSATTSRCSTSGPTTWRGSARSARSSGLTTGRGRSRPRWPSRAPPRRARSRRSPATATSSSVSTSRRRPGRRPAGSWPT